MSAGRRWLVHLVVALVLGGGAAAGAVTWLHEHRDEQREANPVDRALDRSDQVQSLLDGLADDGVFVSTDGRYLLDEQGEQKVAAAVADSETPTYVVVWAPDQQVGAQENDVVDYVTAALERDLADAGEQHGVLFVWQGAEAGDVVELGEGGSVPGFSGPSDLTGDPAVTLPQAVDAADQTYWYDDSDDGDYWGGTGGGVAAGLLFAAGILVPFLFVGWLIRRAAGENLVPGTWRITARRRTR